MSREYASLRRKTFFLPFLVGALCVVASVLAAIGWYQHRQHAERTTLVVVMRHAEKVMGQGADPPLTEEGLARAQRLAAMAVGVQSGLGFDQIYVTEWRRTFDSVEPLLTQRGGTFTRLSSYRPLDVVDSIRVNDVGRRVLVVAHSDTVPAIVHALAPEVTVPDIANTEFGTTYVIAMSPHGRSTVLRLTLP